MADEFYSISPSCAECTLPPALSDSYRRADGPALKVALYLLCTKESSVDQVSDALSISEETVRRALAFWQNAGLIVPGSNLSECGADRASRPDAAPAKTAAVKPARARLTPERAAELTLRDPAIAVLFQETQRFLGRTLDAAESRTLLELYEYDELSVDVILLLVAYCLPRIRNKRSLCSMVSRIADDWCEQGITSLSDAEKQIRLLELREQRETEVAEALEMKDPSFSKSQKALIAKWFEEYGYDAAFVREAYLAKGNSSLAAVGKVLQNWYNSGYTSLRQVRGAGAAPNAPIQSSASRRKNSGSLLKKAVRAGSRED